MAKKTKPLTGIKKLTTREYGGKNSVPRQDTGKSFGRGTVKYKPVRQPGKGV